MAEQHTPTPEIAQTYHDATSFLESEVEGLRRRADDLIGYAYGVVYDGEELDRDELDGFVGSVVGALEELTDSAYCVADAADPQQKELREWLYESDSDPDRDGPAVFVALGDRRRIAVFARMPGLWTVQQEREVRAGQWEREVIPLVRESPILREALKRVVNYANGSRDWALAAERDVFAQIAARRAAAS